jgi:hypothetical protein
MKTSIIVLLVLSLAFFSCAHSSRCRLATGEIETRHIRTHLDGNYVTVKTIKRKNGRRTYKKVEIICQGCTYRYTKSTEEIFYDSAGRKIKTQR